MFHGLAGNIEPGKDNWGHIARDMARAKAALIRVGMDLPP
jgi:hypothetical protein